jgi:hypothetical protein
VETCFSSPSQDDGSGFSMFAPPICRRRWRNNAFPFRQIRRRRRQPSEHHERSEQSNSGSRAAVLRRSERRRSFLCERRRSRWLLGAIRSERSEQSNRALSAVTRSVAIYTAASFHARLILQK